MKKVLALVLAAMMILSIAPMSVSAAGSSLGMSIQDAPAGFALVEGGTAICDIDLSKGDKRTIKVYLSMDAPTPKIAAGQVYMTKADVKDADMSVKYSRKDKVVKNVTIAYSDGKDGAPKGAAYIKIEFVKPYVIESTKDEIDFKYAFVLQTGKNRETYEHEGTYIRSKKEVNEDTDYAYLEKDTDVLFEATEYVKKGEIVLDAGVTVWAKLFKGDYYARATDEILEADEDIINQYPDITKVVTLSTIGLKSASTFVTFEENDKDIFVYNADLEYIGTAADELPWSTKYYLSAKELDVEAADIDEEPIDGGDATEEEPYEDGLGLGGNDAPENVNDSPSTGC